MHSEQAGGFPSLITTMVGHVEKSIGLWQEGCHWTAG